MSVNVLVDELRRYAKALTLWQPWASLMLATDAEGRPAKAVETRPWSTGHRGPLLIHAAKSEPPWVRRIFMEDPNLRPIVERFLRTDREVYAAGILDELPRGQVLGLVDVQRVVRAGVLRGEGLALQEGLLGDYAEDRYGWVCGNPRALARPIPARGGQRLWNPNAVVLDYVAAQLGPGFRA